MPNEGGVSARGCLLRGVFAQGGVVSLPGGEGKGEGCLPRAQNDRQTGVKTLPCPKFRLLAVTKTNLTFLYTIVQYSWLSIRPLNQ